MRKTGVIEGAREYIEKRKKAKARWENFKLVAGSILVFCSIAIVILTLVMACMGGE